MKALDGVELMEAEITMGSPEQVLIWYRTASDVQLEGREAKLNLSLSFNQDTLKYNIQIDQ